MKQTIAIMPQRLSVDEVDIKKSKCEFPTIY